MEMLTTLLTSPEAWMSLLTLTFLEIVLGIDNIIFISIASSRLPDDQQKKATNIGLVLAMVFRVLLLFGISALTKLNKGLLPNDLNIFGIEGVNPTGQSLILFAGGLFLLYKSVSEIHHKLEGESPEAQNEKNKKSNALSNVIMQICLINIVFSFDSILTAIGMTTGVEGALPIMIIAVVLSVIIMMLFAVPVGRFVNRHPTIQMLGLSFLILIGFMLIAEGAHMAHLIEGTVPKGYLYFAIAFSLLVEFLNMRLRKTSKDVVQLHGVKEEAVQEGLIEGIEK